MPFGVASSLSLLRARRRGRWPDGQCLDWTPPPFQEPVLSLPKDGGRGWLTRIRMSVILNGAKRSEGSRGAGWKPKPGAGRGRGKRPNLIRQQKHQNSSRVWITYAEFSGVACHSERSKTQRSVVLRSRGIFGGQEVCACPASSFIFHHSSFASTFRTRRHRCGSRSHG